MPDIIVTVITVVGLWIPDVNARMSISITALLTVIAVMWTITASLPVTEHSTWMQQFSTFCIIIIGLCCFENAIVAYAQTKIGDPPKWTRSCINASNIFSIIYRRTFLFFVDNCCDLCCILYGRFYPVPKRRKRRKKNNVQRPTVVGNDNDNDNGNDDSIDMNSSDIEMNNIHQNNERDDDTVNAEGNADSDDEPIKESNSIGFDEVSNPITKQEHLDDSVGNQDTTTTNTNNNKDDDDEDHPLLGRNEVEELTWIRIGRSIDRICRVAIPIAFSIGTIKLYSES